MQSPRLSRFERDPAVGPMQLTDRDREIIRHVYRHRFLRSSHFVSLMGVSSQQLLRRLQALYHHGYLERPRCQLDFYYRTGSQPIVYGLGAKGAAILEQEFGMKLGTIRWGDKNRAVTRPFLEHTLFVSDILIAIEVACRKSGRIRLLQQEEIISPESLPFRWRVALDDGRKLGIVPDRMFGLEFANTDGKSDRICFILEADRGTMPVIRKDFAQTSMFRKLVAYAATRKQDILRSRFGINRFRVLVVTKSQERVRTLIDACTQLKSGHGLFLLGDARTFSERDPLSFEWHTGRKGKFSTLLD